MLNKVILMGRLVKDVELKQTNSGLAVCSFAIAVDRRFSRQGEERKTDFIDCVAWRQQAEFISKYFGKGNMICVVGNLQKRTWDDNNGVRHYTTEVIVDEVNFTGEKVSGGSQQNNHGGGQDYRQNDGFMPVITDDDLPF